MWGVGQTNLEAALEPFEEETGIEVVYEGTDAFTTLLPGAGRFRGRAGHCHVPPTGTDENPGPGRGAGCPLTEVMDQQALEAAYNDTWLDLGTVDGDLYGIWYRASVKSLVWYSPEEFEARGYEVPETWEEMIALSDRIVAGWRQPLVPGHGKRQCHRLARHRLGGRHSAAYRWP